MNRLLSDHVSCGNLTQERRDRTMRLRRKHELDAALTAEPLDRWSGDGILAADSPDALLARERVLSR